MNGQIFISYRREDGSAWAGRLYDRLQSRFASEKLFMDVDSLAPGVDFVEALERSVGGCDVLITVIGKRWLNASDEEGKRRLDNPEDFVRVEVATALRRGIRVIPVLVDGAPVPRSRELPEDLKALVRRNALEVSHNRFSADSERLIRAVEEVLESARVEQQRKREEQERAETEQREREERERLEAERQQKEAQERLEAERRQREAQERRQAERREIERREQERLRVEQRLRAEQEQLQAKERLEAERRQQAERERLEAQQREEERLEVERRQKEEQERLEAGHFLREQHEAEGRQHERQERPSAEQRPGAEQDHSGAERRKREAQDRLEAERQQKERQQAEAEQRETERRQPEEWQRREAQRRECEEKEQREAERPQTKALGGMGTDSQAPLSSRAPLERVTAKLEKPRRSLALMGFGVVVVVCLLGVGLFKATRPSPVSIGGSPSPTPAPLTAASNRPSPTPLVRLALPSPSPSGAELLAEAKRYLEAGDSAKGLPLLQKAAEAGSVESMNRLGDWYENDDRDYARARQWFQKAAEAGDTHAMNHLGYLYEHGSGVTQDYAQAREWYQKAADAGNAAAKQALARLPSNSSTIASGRTSPEPATPSPSVNEQPAGAAVPPPPHRYATDYANLLRPETLALLNAQLADYERQTSNQFLVAIFSRLPPATDQEAFTREVFRAWKPGQANLNNGAILFVFVREHQVWIQPGKGLTQFLTVDVERHITRDVIAPAFKAGDYDRGVLDGMQAMMAAAKDAYNGDGHTHAER